MKNVRSSRCGNVFALALVSLGAWACGEANTGETTSAAGSGTVGSAGTSSAAGAAIGAAGTTSAGASSTTVAGSGGTSGSSNPPPPGGTAADGSLGSAGQGTAGGSGGIGTTGGRSGGGAGGTGPAGGRGGLGDGGGGGAGGNAPTAGSGNGGTSGCTKGLTKGSEVAVIGESFIALSHGITQEIEKQAKAAGSLGQNDHYVDNSVSGTTLANNQIPSQYTKAAASGTIKYVLMDGGGNDCLLNNNGDAALTAATSLFQTMAQNKTEKVVYFFYPDPVGSDRAALKSCLDTLRPKMKALCDGLTAPKCYWLDLRPTWNGHNEYTSDGIHPTSAGSVATGDVIWDAMKTNCVAQ